MSATHMNIARREACVAGPVCGDAEMCLMPLCGDLQSLSVKLGDAYTSAEASTFEGRGLVAHRTKSQSRMAGKTRGWSRTRSASGRLTNVTSRNALKTTDLCAWDSNPWTTYSKLQIRE